MSNKPKNADIICVNKKALLEYLQFEGGVIHNIIPQHDIWNPDGFKFVLEHPDLHEVLEGYHLTEIVPMYTKHIIIIDGVEYYRNERTDPPKKEIEDGI